MGSRICIALAGSAGMTPGGGGREGGRGGGREGNDIGRATVMRSPTLTENCKKPHQVDLGDPGGRR